MFDTIDTSTKCICSVSTHVSRVTDHITVTIVDVTLHYAVKTDTRPKYTFTDIICQLRTLIPSSWFALHWFRSTRGYINNITICGVNWLIVTTKNDPSTRKKSHRWYDRPMRGHHWPNWPMRRLQSIRTNILSSGHEINRVLLGQVSCSGYGELGLRLLLVTWHLDVDGNSGHSLGNRGSVCSDPDARCY